MAYCCIIATARKCGHCSLFLKSKKIFLIRLHSSASISTPLVTRLHSSKLVWWLVYTRLWFVYIRLPSSGNSSVFLKQILLPSVFAYGFIQLFFNVMNRIKMTNKVWPGVILSIIASNWILLVQNFLLIIFPFNILSFSRCDNTLCFRAL